MLFGYLVGNFLGRLLISFALVWLVWFLSSRFNAKAALMRCKKWYSVLAITVLTLLGVLSAVAKAGAGQ